MTTREFVCRLTFRPYLEGQGPIFRLVTWDTGRTGFGGKYLVGYRLSMRTPDGRHIRLFEGEDFGCSPMYAIDSREACAGIMAFLTLRPGDTDREYFADYTPRQLAYCHEHAEALSYAVIDRLGDI